MRDPYIEVHASGRALGDGGIQELVDGLCEALKSHDSILTSRLEELCLSGNNLTPLSLACLSRVIETAAEDLKEVDLSSNRITVSTDDEAGAWETFLRSFRSCSVMRRLDLSGNDLGPRAFELLARVYTREEALDMTSTEMDEEVKEESMTSVDRRLRKANIAEVTTAAAASRHLRKASRQGGLRA